MPLTPRQTTVDQHLCQRLLDIHRQVWLSLLWVHCSFFLGPGAHKALLCPSRVCFPGSSQSFCWIPRLGNLLWALELLQQCMNFFGIIVPPFVGCLLGGSMVELVVTSSKRSDATCHTSQVCCCQCPCPHGRSLLTHAFTGDTKTLSGRFSSVSCGGHCSFPLVLVHTRFCLHSLSTLEGLQMVTSTMKLKDAFSLEEKL